MTVSADKLASRAIALAVVGYCIWPSISQFAAEQKAASPQNKSELAAALLRPVIAPPPTRDPFESSGTAPRALGKRGMGGEGDPAGQTAGRGTAAGQNAGPFAGLTLEGTCIVGDRRLAIINGNLYAPRETLAERGAAPAPCKVLGVFPYKVVLECQGKTVELSYSDVASGAASAQKSRGLLAPGEKPASRSSTQKR